MSTGLMSCVRENTPPLVSSGMQAEITSMSLPSEYSEPQKRRRFNALKNLRRIFRRRTVASTETLPCKGKIRSHIAPSDHQHLDATYFRDSFNNAFKQPSLVSIRSKGATKNPIEEFECNSGRNYTCSIDCDRGFVSNNAKRITVSGATGTGSISRPSQVEDYAFDECRPRDRHKKTVYVNQTDRGAVQKSSHPYGSTSTGDWTNGAHKRSHSEDRLKEGVPLDQELSKSHESVFREPHNMAMLTIGLKTELIDVLRKRRSRPESCEQNLESTPSPKRSSAEMYDLRNTLPVRKIVDPDVQVRLIGIDVCDLAPLTPPHSHKKQLFPEHHNEPETSGLLSHSAARHKMAVRPKKKGPTRFRRSAEVAPESDINLVIPELSFAKETHESSSKPCPTIRQMSADQFSVNATNSTALGIDHLSHIPNISDRSLLSTGPTKSTRSLLEDPKSSNRLSSSEITKSDEYLQETGKSSSRPTSVHCGDTSLTPRMTNSPCINKISGVRRKSVEKSQSFKMFTHQPAVNQFEGVTDRKDLYSMNRPVSYKEFSRTGHDLETPKPTVRSSLLESKVSGTKHPVSSILPIVKSNNIIQIEENIDKLVSSPFVPLLKKMASQDSNKVKQNNVSITTIRPVAEAMKNDLPAKQVQPLTPHSPSVHLRRRSSSTMEKSPSVGSLNTLASEECKVPEFLRIHLNRVDSTRPKSSIVLYKGTCDTLPRRYSRELDSTKPPLPPVFTAMSTLKRPSINKSQETITESNHVIIVPVHSTRKSSVELVANTEPVVEEPVTVQQIAVVQKGALEPKSDSVNNGKIKEELCERKGSVSEEKAKIERRLSIADEKSFIRKKSLPNPHTGNKASNKEDNTPELMKVFARRSMKLKDDDEEDTTVQKSQSQSSVVTDSDKENQSSSREELSPKSKSEDETKVSKSKTENDSYRPRTFFEVKKMLHSTNTNTISAGKTVTALRQQKDFVGVQNETVIPVAAGKKEPPLVAAPTNKNVVDTSSLEADAMPEFKRILERRAEWESRSKMWK